MLTKEVKSKLQSLGFDLEKLTEAVKAEDEQSLEVPNLILADKAISPEDKEKFGNNRFEEGKKAVNEIIAKQVSDKFNLGLEDGDPKRKDINAVVSLYGEKVLKEANIEPDKKVASIKAEKEQLQQKVLSLTEEITKKDSEYQSRMFNIEVDSKLKTLVPQGSVIPADGVLAWYKKDREIKKADHNGSPVIGVFKEGEMLKTDLLEPIPYEDDFKTFLDTNKIGKVNGMGGGDEDFTPGSAKFKSYSQFKGYCDSNGLNPMSNEAQKILLENRAEDYSQTD